MVKAYEVYLSTDGKNWGTAVAAGEFKNTTALQVAQLKTPTAGRYLKFVAKSEVNNNAWTSAAEVGIEAESDVTAIEDPHFEALLNTRDIYYNLQGLPVKNPGPGIYICNGKKVLK
jgi:hypothetical protein